MVQDYNCPLQCLRSQGTLQNVLALWEASLLYIRYDRGMQCIQGPILICQLTHRSWRWGWDSPHVIIIVLCTQASCRTTVDEYCYKSCPFREVHCMSLCKLWIMQWYKTIVNYRDTHVLVSWDLALLWCTKRRNMHTWSDPGGWMGWLATPFHLHFCKGYTMGIGLSLLSSHPQIFLDQHLTYHKPWQGYKNNGLSLFWSMCIILCYSQLQEY